MSSRHLPLTARGAARDEYLSVIGLCKQAVLIVLRVLANRSLQLLFRFR